MIFILCVVLFCVGLFAVIAGRNMIKIIIGIGIMECAINLFFALCGYRTGGRAPVLTGDAIITHTVDPLPQALVLTSIVIGLGVMALLVATALRLYEKYETFDIAEMRSLRG